MISGNWITLTNIEIKNIIKVIRSLENREIFLNRTTRKINSQEGELLTFLGPLMTVSLSLKNVLTSLAKNILLPLGVTASASATDAAIQKRIHGSDMITMILPSEEMKTTKKFVKSP